MQIRGASRYSDSYSGVDRRKGWNPLTLAVLAGLSGSYYALAGLYAGPLLASAGIEYKAQVPGLHGSITPRLDWFYTGSIAMSVRTANAGAD